MLTTAKEGQNGSIFHPERAFWDNFKLTAEVELRDGQSGGPSGGLAIVIIGTEDAPGLGGAGEGMGATGLGAVPTMVVVLDSDKNEVGFAWSHDGFPSGPIPLQHSMKLDKPLNNKQAHPAEPNRWTVVTTFTGDHVKVHLKNSDMGFEETEVLEIEIPHFEPFEGYLGLTAATIGTGENHLVHSLRSVEVTPGPGAQHFFRGDPNDDGKSDITDAIVTLGFLFLGGTGPVCMDSADVDNSGIVDISDPVNLLNYLFGTGAPPASPGPPGAGGDCDHDPHDPVDDLECEKYSSCPIS